MTLPRVSVCVVSWHRPEALRRVLVALGQLDYPELEIVVVADAVGLAGLAPDLPIKRVTVAEANISAARNIAIAQSAGQIVAFIDDDAVPEPTWLRYLCAPFADARVAATGGFVRGRNGISWQWRGRVVNALGETIDYVPGSAVPDGYACKTEGTNMAVRRDVLCDLGGFDPAFHFFLDETDLNLRLHAAGYRTVLVPEAEVHHGFLASERRRADRVPLDLHEIGASWSVFLRKHVGDADRLARLQVVRAEETARLIRHMISGALEPRDVRRVRRTFEAGVQAGAHRALNRRAEFDPAPDFVRFPTRQRRHTYLECRPAAFETTMAAAQARVDAGENATVFNLSGNSFYHYITYTNKGVWVHTGGLFGKSERNQPFFWFWTREKRFKTERSRVSRARNFADEVAGK